MKELGEFELLTSFEPLRCSRTFSKNRKGRELVFTKEQKFFAQFLTSPISFKNVLDNRNGLKLTMGSNFTFSFKLS